MEETRKWGGQVYKRAYQLRPCSEDNLIWGRENRILVGAYLSRTNEPIAAVVRDQSRMWGGRRKREATN